MTRRMFDFQCACGNKFERLIDDHEYSTECPECESTAQRIISPVRLDWRMGADSSLPTMADKWARMHEQAAKAHKKEQENE